MQTRMMMRLLMVSMLTLAAGPAAYADDEFNRVADGQASVAFVLPVEEATYRTMLDQLPANTVTIDREAVEKLLTRQIEQFDIDLGDQAPADVAAQVYDAVIEPKMQPRVDALNDGMNEAMAADKVGVGLLAFTGLAKGMAEASSRTVSSALVQGVYHYAEGEPDHGRWKWHDAWISDITAFRRNYNLVIDEKMDIDLAPFGARKNERGRTSIPMTFNCTAKVTLEQTYSFDYINNEPAREPETAVRFRPYVDVTATKATTGDNVFTITGEKHKTVRERIEHNAIHELNVEARLNRAL